MSNHTLTAAEIELLDHAHEAAAASLSELLAGTGPALRQGVEEDGVAVAVARLTAELMDQPQHYLASLAALAIARLVGVS